MYLSQELCIIIEFSKISLLVALFLILIIVNNNKLKYKVEKPDFENTDRKLSRRTNAETRNYLKQLVSTNPNQ